MQASTVDARPEMGGPGDSRTRWNPVRDQVGSGSEHHHGDHDGHLAVSRGRESELAMPAEPRTPARTGGSASTVEKGCAAVGHQGPGS
eukprot:2505811-Rhodomonas_salina.1